ncbi:CobQ-like glutamine amidotransferase family enzyme [Breznakia sp. PF5-3]|uniref:type 1 glutamine amidotransferase n=1 Tax=unclassified Breznakia TaxID=2623764 RepID=UPI0024058401|nr:MULTISPECIES: glutamine amidotransferase [unclassified Breznakia]MDF9824064.1 CobQ-like glutamine amidotransferase family enzyme [Breznakia sp. PM6-1]MDF9834870.1 CobQ-like glutamine amidotransferase family enzyme [Breznakia sp. PF5-3]MDF9837108.1 CobQ-like glutamine amidotransferase family enzyme [Breznakia sp. PFB2-8]MDF9859033.1 CobQ-like glutamine amidotransferase family enzyme [Breznakia sp. PH5-24]
MKMKILWMYHDIMDLYGDRGNIQVLKKRCLDRDIEVSIDTCGIGEQKNLNDYHLIFIGGGADREQHLLYQDLVNRKQDILDAIKAHTFVLLICGGYQFFGKYYIDSNGNRIEGLGLFEYYTESNSDVGRCIGNIEIEADLDGEKVSIVGFENHGGQTKNIKTPLGKVIKGHGNVYRGEFEGFYNGQVLGTYMHGPLLPKNPEMADFIIKKALHKDYEEVMLKPLDDTLELEAKETMRKRMQQEKG